MAWDAGRKWRARNRLGHIQPRAVQHGFPSMHQGSHLVVPRQASLTDLHYVPGCRRIGVRVVCNSNVSVIYCCITNYPQIKQLKTTIFFFFQLHGSEIHKGTSLVAQLLRIRPPVQETWVQALGREDPTCCGATEPVHHNY